MKKKDITINYACLACHKVFKKAKYKQDNHGTWSAVDYDVVCPQCASRVYPTGSAFKAPKATDNKAWERLNPLFESGYQFNPDFGNPFDDVTAKKQPRKSQPESEFRKPARKRLKGSR